MRKLVAITALLVAVAVPSAASAQIFLGARLGYGFPWGEMWDGADLKDYTKAQVPLQLDLGLKLGKALALGAYAGYGFAMLDDDLKDDCDAANFDCSAAVIRFGVQANLHAANTETTEFWGGVSLGYTRLAGKETFFGEDISLSGYEAGLQGGFDFLGSPNFRIGPFASLTVGQYTKWETDDADGDIEDDLGDTTMHGWFQIGIRGMWGN